MQSLNTIITAPLKLLGEYEIEVVVIGGVAATLFGSTQLTNDLHVCYARNSKNLEKLASALQSVNAHLRGVPDNVPFLLDAATLRKGLNFTFITDIGSVDLLGEVRGVGGYDDVLEGSVTYELFGYHFQVIEIGRLILAKRAAGRPKDLIAIPELEAIQERQSIEDKH